MVGRVSINTSEVREKTFGLAPEVCYLEITIDTTSSESPWVTGETDEQSDGTCTFTYSFWFNIEKKCVCRKPGQQKDKFNWEDFDQGCDSTGNRANYGAFTAKFWVRAYGSCPPGTCKGKWGKDNVVFTETINQVGCDRDPCTARTSNGTMNKDGMKQTIMNELRKRIRHEYGGRMAKCPKEDDPPTIDYLL